MRNVADLGDLFEVNDLAAPSAVVVTQGLGVLNQQGRRYVEEAWASICEAFSVDRDSGLRLPDKRPALALCDGAENVLSVVLQVRLLILSESAHVVMIIQRDAMHDVGAHRR